MFWCQVWLESLYIHTGRSNYCCFYTCHILSNTLSYHLVYLCVVSAKGAVLILRWAIPWEIPSHLRHTSWSSQLIFLPLLPVSVADCSSMLRKCIHKAINRGLTVNLCPGQVQQHRPLFRLWVYYEWDGGVHKPVKHTETYTQRARAECYRKRHVKREVLPSALFVFIFLYVTRVKSVFPVDTGSLMLSQEPSSLHHGIHKYA